MNEDVKNYTVTECSVSSTVNNDGQLAQWLRDICNPQGLKDLVACCSGSCEEAIRLLVQVMLDSS